MRLMNLFEADEQNTGKPYSVTAPVSEDPPTPEVAKDPVQSRLYSMGYSPGDVAFNWRLGFRDLLGLVADATGIGVQKAIELYRAVEDALRGKQTGYSLQTFLAKGQIGDTLRTQIGNRKVELRLVEEAGIKPPEYEIVKAPDVLVALGIGRPTAVQILTSLGAKNPEANVHIPIRVKIGDTTYNQMTHAYHVYSMLTNDGQDETQTPVPTPTPIGSKTIYPHDAEAQAQVKKAREEVARRIVEPQDEDEVLAAQETQAQAEDERTDVTLPAIRGEGGAIHFGDAAAQAHAEPESKVVEGEIVDVPPRGTNEASFESIDETDVYKFFDDANAFQILYVDDSKCSPVHYFALKKLYETLSGKMSNVVKYKIWNKMNNLFSSFAARYNSNDVLDQVYAAYRQSDDSNKSKKYEFIMHFVFRYTPKGIRELRTRKKSAALINQIEIANLVADKVGAPLNEPIRDVHFDAESLPFSGMKGLPNDKDKAYDILIENLKNVYAIIRHGQSLIQSLTSTPEMNSKWAEELNKYLDEVWRLYHEAETIPELKPQQNLLSKYIEELKLLISRFKQASKYEIDTARETDEAPPIGGEETPNIETDDRLVKDIISNWASVTKEINSGITVTIKNRTRIYYLNSSGERDGLFNATVTNTRIASRKIEALAKDIVKSKNESGRFIVTPSLLTRNNVDSRPNQQIILLLLIIPSNYYGKVYYKKSLSEPGPGKSLYDLAGAYEIERQANESYVQVTDDFLLELI